MLLKAGNNFVREEPFVAQHMIRKEASEGRVGSGQEAKFCCHRHLEKYDPKYIGRYQETEPYERPVM
jgi:hypothetical protein